MNSKEFRQFGYQMIDFVADLNDKLVYKDPTPNIKPGYMQELVPKAPPENPEPFAKIMADIEPVILKGVRVIISYHDEFRSTAIAIGYY